MAPARLLLLASLVVGCAGETPPPLDCSDPLGGELHGVYAPSDGSAITLGVVDTTPRVVHVSATSDQPSGTVLDISSNGVSFVVHIEGAPGAYPTRAYVSGGPTDYGDGSVMYANRCPPRADGEPEGLSGTVTMSFHDQPIDGWFNGYASGGP